MNLANYKLWHRKLMQIRKGATIPGQTEETIEAKLDDIYPHLTQEERKLVKAYINEELSSRKVY